MINAIFPDQYHLIYQREPTTAAASTPIPSILIPRSSISIPAAEPVNTGGSGTEVWEEVGKGTSVEVQLPGAEEFPPAYERSSTRTGGRGGAASGEQLLVLSTNGSSDSRIVLRIGSAKSLMSVDSASGALDEIRVKSLPQRECWLYRAFLMETLLLSQIVVSVRSKSGFLSTRFEMVVLSEAVSAANCGVRAFVSAVVRSGPDEMSRRPRSMVMMKPLDADWMHEISASALPV